MSLPLPSALTEYQKWILFYFLKNKDVAINLENLADNMCLSAIERFDLNKFRKDLNQLVDAKLIESYIPVGTAAHLYRSTLEGRLYVKQKIIIPLINAKNNNEKLPEIISYLRSHPDRELADQIEDALNTENQDDFLKRVSDSAITHLIPFLEILEKIKNLMGL